LIKWRFLKFLKYLLTKKSLSNRYIISSNTCAQTDPHTTIDSQQPYSSFKGA
jgi:hypothetical protein